MTDPVYVPIPEDHDEDVSSPVSVEASPLPPPEYPGASSSSYGASATHLPIPSEDPDEVVAEQQPRASSSRQPVFVPGGRDGVFSNMSAKPEVADPNSQTPGKIYEDIEPPNYSDVVVENEPAPPYLENTILTNLMETGDVVIDGYPVGTMAAFMWSMLVSALFDFIGYFMTTILATSHAGRFGSRAGLGATLIRVGMLVKYHRDDRVDVIDPELLDRMEKQKEWISIVLIAVGSFILFKANGDYLAMRQARLMLLAADFV